MTEYLAALAPDDQMPEIIYTRVNARQADRIKEGLDSDGNGAGFAVSFLPIETLEQRQAAAEEWAGYEQAAGQASAREQGAFLVVTTRDRSPEYFLGLLEDEDYEPTIPFAPWITHVVLKAVKLEPDASLYGLVASDKQDSADTPTA